MKIINKEFYAKGKRGFVSTATIPAEMNNKKVLIKEKNPESDANTIANEAEMLRILNKKGIGPEYIHYDKKNNQLIREFIDGPRIDEFLKECTLIEAKTIIKQVLKQCLIMDELGINKFEMTNPYKHILIKKETKKKNSKKIKAVMIDFERCKFTKKPKNITQFCQYLAKPQIHDMIKEKGLDYDVDELRRLAADYKKQGFNKKIYKKIINIFN